jgi:MFS-type transporter involved in bile tolerance (Atg22 family)
MKTNRWTIAMAGVCIQVALGATYGWSVFRTPLVEQFGWSIPRVTLTFTISIVVLGFAALVGGLWLNRTGPRVVAITGGLLYGAGTIPAFAADYFGGRNVGPIYGLLMTALGFSSAFGPLLMDYMRQMSGDYRGALHVIAGVMAVSLVLPLVVAPPQGDQRQALSPMVAPTAGQRSSSAMAVVSGNKAAQKPERN